MSTQASDLIQDALEMLGVYAPGETVNTADSARALESLNIIIDEFASRQLYIQQYTPHTFMTVPSQPNYSIGPNGTVNAPRPGQLVMGDGGASILVGATTTPVNVVSGVVYRGLAAFEPVAGLPDTLWYNPTYPLGSINLLPAPFAGGSTVTFSAWSVLPEFATTAASANLAVGVQEVLTDALAVKLKSYFSDGNLQPVVAVRAANASDVLRYQSMTSRAMFKRYALSTNPQVPQV